MAEFRKTNWYNKFEELMDSIDLQSLNNTYLMGPINTILIKDIVDNIEELNKKTKIALREDDQLQNLISNVQELLKNYYAKKYFNETDEKEIKTTKKQLSDRELYKLKVAIYKLESYVNLKKIEGKEAPSSKLSKIFDLKYNYNLKKSKYDKLFDYFAREETVKNLDIKKLEEEINKENDKVILRGEEISLGLLMEAITKEPSIILNPIINQCNYWGFPPPDPFYLNLEIIISNISAIKDISIKQDF